MLKVIGTALLTAVLTSVFWIWFYGVVPQPAPEVTRSGPVVTVKPENAPPVVVAEQIRQRVRFVRLAPRMSFPKALVAPEGHDHQPRHVDCGQ